METIKYTADMVVFAMNVTPFGSTFDSVLMIERRWAPFEGRLALPGGHVDPGETSRQAAVRELREETGVDLALHETSRLVPVGVFDKPGRDPRGRYISAAYAVSTPSELPVEAADDAARAVWVPLRLLLSFMRNNDLAFDHTQIISAAMNTVRTLRRAGEAR